MKKPLQTLLAALALCVSASAAPISLPDYGFQIDPLDGNPGAASAQALITFLPPVDGFSPNVNVMIQPYPRTMADYIELSKGQFSQMGWTVVSEKNVSDTEWIAEYTGSMNGSPLHWYARAVLSDGKVYLVTGTCAAASWDSVGDALKSSVGSFKLK